MTGSKQIVAVALLTRADVEAFGTRLARLYPIDGHDDHFADLLRAIDEVDSAIIREPAPALVAGGGIEHAIRGDDEP